MAAGKTLIGGTAYDITAGKTLIGGTAYDITAGKTLVGGTAYDISFGSAPPPTLRNLLLDMTLFCDASINAATATQVATAYKAASAYPDLLYIISAWAGNMSVSYSKNTGKTDWETNILNYVGTNTSIPSWSSQKTGSNYRLRFAYVNRNTGIYTIPNVNGASLLLVTFPSYTQAQIYAVLRGMTITNVAGRDSTSTGYVRTNSDKGHDYYITTKYKRNGSSYTGSDVDNTGFVIWESDGSTWTMLNQVTPNWQAGQVSSGYLTLGSCYGGSIVALDEPT